MTVNEAAQKYGVSKQMIYRILNKSGKPINQLKDPESGVLTDIGAAILADRYSKQVDTVNRVDSKRIDSLQTELTATKTALDAALAKINEMAAARDSAIADRDEMKKANEALSAQLAALQAEHEKLHAHLAAAFESIKNLSTLALPVVEEAKSKPKKKHWWNKG